MADEKELTSAAAEAVEETTAEPVEEAVQETAAEPVEEAVEEIAAEPVEEAVEETAAEPVEEAVQEIAAEPVEEAVEEIAAEPAAEAVEETAAEPAAEAVQETTAEPVKKADKEQTPAKPKSTVGDKLMTALGVVLCILLAPILIANITMIVKSYNGSGDVPSFGGYCPFIVMTDSMVPTINGGDLVIDRVVTDPEQIKRGDVISFFDPASRSKNIVTHRVEEVTNDKNGIAFITKGDANQIHDDDVVPGKNVVGVYWFRIPGMGKVVMFMQSTTGLVVCVALPILLLIGYDALRRRKYDRQQQADTDALLKELEELRSKQAE